MERSVALEQRIQELTRRLEHHCDRITRCHVVVDSPIGSQCHHGAFQVHLELTTPGSVLHASNTPLRLPEHGDAYIALRDAFEAAKQQLMDGSVVH
jgi:hypothetical protein